MPRVVCNRCHKAQTACICSWVEPVHNHTRVVILQHPDELGKALGTARIAHLCLERVALWVGTDFSCHDSLRQITNSPNTDIALLNLSVDAVDISQWLDETGGLASEAATSASSKSTEVGHGERERVLVVLDGTWRNVREILLATPCLQQLKKVTFSHAKCSNYRIRKAPLPNALSTVEAIVEALLMIEPETQTSVMLECFKKMIDHQISCMGDKVYKANYLTQ